jgi:hypothetical protein
VNIIEVINRPVCAGYGGFASLLLTAQPPRLGKAGSKAPTIKPYSAFS